MTPLAITLGLPPLHPEERARLPKVVRVADVLADGKLPPDVVYVGQGHHSHRIPRSQWASPFVQGHTCTTDDWLPLYVDFVLASLQAELPALQGKRLACDCGPDGVCEADALAGMVFDATHPDAETSLPRVTGRRHRQARGSVLRAAAIMGSIRGGDALQSMPLWFPQEDVILAFRKLYPAEWFQSFQWPMLEDLLNQAPFTCYLDWRQSRGMEWDGPLGPPSSSNTSRRRQRLAEGKQHGAYNHKASIPPLVGYGQDADTHFAASLQWTTAATPLEVLPTLDDDLWYAASMVTGNDNLKERRRASIGAIKELKRRWAPVSKHLVAFQSEAIRGVTSKRDLGLLGLFVVIMQWGDFALPHGFIKGLPAVGYAPHYGVFPYQPVEAIAHSEVLAGWEEHNAATTAGVRPGSTDSFVLEQSTKDHREGFCTPPMTLSQLKRYAKGDPYRLIPRCVITQASGKQRLIDDAARGGQSASSRDSNKLVLCTPLRPALHVQAAAACLQECTWERFAQQGQWTGAGDDWPNAYRHCPMSRQEALACVVVWYHQEWQGPAYQVYHALLFGLPLAVTSFNRYSRMAEALGRRFLAIMVSMYFDDSHITDRAVHGPSAQWSFGVLNDLLGTPFAEEKRQGAADVGTFLGLDFDLSEIHTHGRARFWVRERLEQKVLTFMHDARESGKFTPGQAAKLYGMVNFLEHGLFGRIGLGEIQALKEHQYGALAVPAPASCRPSMCWKPSSVCAPGESSWFCPWTCREWWQHQTPPWRHPVKGQEATTWSSRMVERRSGKPLWPSSPRRSMTCGGQETIK